MSIHRHGQPAGAADKTDPAPYEWTHKLPSLAWAWEFLRRNPKYRADFSAGHGDAPVAAEPSCWPLLRLTDPSQDALFAEVFWRKEACVSVLPLASAPRSSDELARSLSLDGVQCRVTVIDEGDVHHVLLSQEGRWLQLEVHGPMTGAVLLTPALFLSKTASGRLTAMKRLNDVVTHGVLRPELYPPEGRAVRLATKLLALDGWLAKAHYRDIAIRLFGAQRVATEWSDPGNHMRDHIRRAVLSGREMMESGYRRLLD
ncbi:DUF2285 domain-containing protein [Rhizomicrobium electricum]|uniref:DUF2285 domain-containing protein n=1 Tax=Rhizomicrobium electricum TaxID=480070 RepID=A0ABN1F7L5_9PROT|nr:DUF2285 domain-containing protein [Rhizomicrobium electricum]NIJ46699.1 hypothetical protein [Rhizomicrobium electricum]